jgi:hypothetical protein
LTNLNPYSSPTTHESRSVNSGAQTTRRLWIAYGIASPVAPLVGAVTVFVVGMVHLANHPEDTGTPIGVTLFPIALLVAGVPASYAVAGVLGMPIAFWLRRRGRLNGYTVHGAALVGNAAVAMGLMLLALPLISSAHGEPAGFTEWLIAALILFLVLVPFVMLSATTFWLIGVRRGKSPPDTEPPDGRHQASFDG